MRKLSLLFVLTIFLITIILVSGCPSTPPTNPPPFKPSVTLGLDKGSIIINDNSISDFITATITRLDNENVDTFFVLKFPENKQTFYPTDVDGQRITELSTKPLRDQNSKDILQFKIFGTKGEDKFSVKELRLELWWNNTKIDGQDKIIEVTVN